MKIVVIGGTGQVGAPLVAKLTAAGHEAVAASRSTGVDARTGEGLDAALEGAQVVVDVTSTDNWDDDALRAFFVETTQSLLAAEARAGVGHHVVLSIVGMDRTDAPGAYYRAKLAQEEAVRAGTIPYTIARATQFMEFLATIAEFSGHRVPPAPMQPIAVDDVATLLAQVATEPPADGIVDLAGPEVATMDELTARVTGAEITADPEATYFGTPWSDDLLVGGPGARLGTTTLSAWLAAHDRA